MMVDHCRNCSAKACDMCGLKNIAAYTAPNSFYPEYVSINRKGDDVEITVRGPHQVVNGVAVCGKDCRPGNDMCNGYCSGVHDSPRRMKHRKEGLTVTMSMPFEEYERMFR